MNFGGANGATVILAALMVVWKDTNVCRFLRLVYISINFVIIFNYVYIPLKLIFDIILNIVL